MNILAVTIGGLGDAVLFSPVIKALRTRHPRALIRMLVASELAASAYAGGEEIDCIDVLDLKGRSKARRALELIKFSFQSRRRCHRYDLGIYATGLNPGLSRALARLAGVRTTIRAPLPPIHATDLECNVALARQFDAGASAADAFVPILPAAEKEADRALQEAGIGVTDRLVAVYPSTELAHRPRWPLSDLVTIVERIRQRFAPSKIVVLGNRAEGRQWAVADPQGMIDANLAGELTIRGSAALLRRCRLVVGNDGGLMHVAGAVDCPLVVVMVKTPPAYRPPGRQTTVICSGPGCGSDSYRERPTRSGEGIRREAISNEAIYQACARILAQENQSSA
jgi:heptosyltransferase-2